jgi:hypothetical protein
MEETSYEPRRMQELTFNRLISGSTGVREAILSWEL